MFTVRYGTVRYGTVRYGTVRYGTVRYGTVRYGTVRYGTVRYGTVRYGTVRYGTVRYGTVRYGTVRYGTVHTYTPPAPYTHFAHRYVLSSILKNMSEIVDRVRKIDTLGCDVNKALNIDFCRRITWKCLSSHLLCVCVEMAMYPLCLLSRFNTVDMMIVFLVY